MNNSAKSNAAILAVLEAYGLNWKTFAALRSDSYEQQLAKSSLEDLDNFYSLIFAPGISLELKAQACPVWPPGTKYAGAKPSQAILSEVATRWNSERTLDVVAEVGKMMEQYHAKLSRTPGAEVSAVTDSLFAMLSQELLKSKLEGENLATKLKTMDRLLRKQGMDFNREKFKEGLRTKLEAGLDALAEELKHNPEAMKLYQQARKMITTETQ